MGIPALPFYEMNFVVLKTVGIANPQTLGDHLKNQRLKLHLFQKDIAKIFNVSEDTVTNWENNRVQPQIQFYPILIDFLGYFPFTIDTTTVAGKLKEYRYRNGLSQKKLGKILGVDATTVGAWENGTTIPKKIQSIIFAEN
jgi:DNA-binding XRE family transcriptional regulator